MTPPRNEAELLARAQACAGLTVAQLAQACGDSPPRDLRRHKGWVGELLERALGASSASKPQPDFADLGIELKTIPLADDGRPRESTHVCTINLSDLIGQRWETSTVRRKLARVLWMPIEAAPAIPLAQRRIGLPLLWTPTAAQESVLRADWEEHMELLATGALDLLDARLGTYLQVRPKAANSRALAGASDADGAPLQTLPRGFYLRTAFTRALLAHARAA